MRSVRKEEEELKKEGVADRIRDRTEAARRGEPSKERQMEARGADWVARG